MYMRCIPFSLSGVLLYKWHILRGEGKTCSVHVRWNLYIVVALGPAFCGCNIEGGCIIEVHNSLAVMYVGTQRGGLTREVAAL